MVVQFVCIFLYSLILSEQYHPLGGYGSWAMRFMPWFCAGSHQVASILQFVPFSPLPEICNVCVSCKFIFHPWTWSSGLTFSFIHKTFFFFLLGAQGCAESFLNTYLGLCKFPGPFLINQQPFKNPGFQPKPHLYLLLWCQFKATFLTHAWELCLPLKGFPGGLVVKNLPASAVDTGLIPVQGRSYMPGQLSPFAEAPCLEPVLYNKRSHRNEKPAYCNEE